MFLFVKFVYPSLFESHILKIKRETNEMGQEYQSQLKTAQQAIETRKPQDRHGAKESTFQKIKFLFHWYLKQRRMKGQTDRMIEVFDVLIQSKMRLVLFDLDSGQELLLNEGKSDYLARMRQQQLKAQGE
jgi:hypothetical protein